MNGMATVSPLFRPNLCQCGHDYVNHTIALPLLTNPTNNLCALCIFTLGTQNRHFFAHPTECIPALSFLNSPAYGYICGSAFGQSLILQSSNVSQIPSGTNSVGPIANIAQLFGMGILKPGMTISPIPSSPQNWAQYTIIGNSGTNLLVSPAFLFNVPANAQLILSGDLGSTMGAGSPGNNYQRAG